MKPRIQCALTQWIPGFTVAGVPASCVRGPGSGSRRLASGAWHPASGTQPRTNRAQPLIRGKPFLTAGKHLTDYGELPTARASPERIEGVSRSLPYSDLLTLTSSHMFFSVMN